MVKFLKISLIAIFVVGAAAQAKSQQKTVTLECADIPKMAVDTLPTDRGDVKIVTFSDNSFRYIHADYQAFTNNDTYRKNWDTVAIFAYKKVPLESLTDTIHLQFGSYESLSQFRSPAQGNVVSKYGPRGRRTHQGTDIQVYHGQPIFAAFDGVVRISRWNSGGYGNLIIIRHPNGLETYYSHLSRRAVAAGEFVRAGQVVGYGGKTGRAFGNHLHFETRFADQSFDAERIFDFYSQTLHGTDFALLKSYFDANSRAGFEDHDVQFLTSGDTSDSTAVALSDERLLAEKAAEKSVEAAEKHTQIPAEKPASKAVHHTISSGDTLLALALKHGTTVARICELNGITRTTTLKIGRKLRIK